MTTNRKLPRELAGLVALARKQGWRVLSDRRHVVLAAPDGHTLVTLSSTASDRRAMRNGLSMMKKAGYRP